MSGRPLHFVHDTLAGGGTVRVPSIVDVYTWELLALVRRRVASRAQRL